MIRLRRCCLFLYVFFVLLFSSGDSPATVLALETGRSPHGEGQRPVPLERFWVLLRFFFNALSHGSVYDSSYETRPRKCMSCSHSLWTFEFNYAGKAHHHLACTVCWADTAQQAAGAIVQMWRHVQVATSAMGRVSKDPACANIWAEPANLTFCR